MSEEMWVGGPMFERAISGLWQSVHGKDGGHYNNFGCDDEDGMDALRAVFPDGQANEMNFVLFSTSGVHGSYATIEEQEAFFDNGCVDEDGESYPPAVTFLIVQPRICTLRHGNCIPQSRADFEFLRQLRASSWEAVLRIGEPAEGSKR